MLRVLREEADMSATFVAYILARTRVKALVTADHFGAGGTTLRAVIPLP